MNLYLNTSGKLCEIALLSDSLVLDHMIHERSMEHSMVLHDMIGLILSKNNIQFSDINAIGILNGPGSYTGLRVGLAAAKGICYALDIPLVLFNQLELCCEYYKDLYGIESTVASIVPARAGEFFFCLCQGSKYIFEPSVYELETIRNLLENDFNPHVLLSPSNESNIEIPFSNKYFEVPLEYILKEIRNRLINNDLNDIYVAEPFYLKKVHINTPKKRF